MKVIKFIEREFVAVDDWVPEPEDKIFRHTKDFIIVPISKYYNVDDVIDYFNISKKRCYNDHKMREHITRYINYFLKFYDTNHELYYIYANLKYLMSLDEYDKKAFFYDIKKYVFSLSMRIKINAMNRDNYSLSLKYKNKKDPALQYTNKHGYLMMEMSLMMNLIIPLLTHFIYVKKINDTNKFLLEAFDIIISQFNMDLYSKLYETSLTNINKDRDNNPIWSKQDIRGINTTTHAMDSVENIILQIMPKYEYSQNIIVFNYQAIKNNIGYRVTTSGYEYTFVPLYSSKRDEDMNSEFDKFENYLAKADESLYLQNKVNCQETMKQITQHFGPFDQDEINFYMKQLTQDGKTVINQFQKDLIFNLFYKYFGDVVSIKAINKEDYVKLMITAKKILLSHNMIILPYIISGKVNRLPQRKNINKKELNKIQNSPFFKHILAKYNNPKIEKYIFSLIATILVADFQIIDYSDPELNGKHIEMIPDIVCEEILMYILLI